MSPASTPADILRAVERWARVRGFVMHSRTGYNAYDNKGWGIHVNPLPPNGSLLIVPPGVNELMGVEVSPALALAFALLVESGAASVDAGRCPSCVARGGPMEWAQREHSGEAMRLKALGFVGDMERRGWEAALVKRPRTKRPRWPASMVGVASRPCPACTGTGRETLPAERLLLDAADPMQYGILLVHADQLQAAGNPLGTLLAWALGPWTGEPTAEAMCSECEGEGYRETGVEHGGMREGYDCPDCEGRGHIPGHPHTAEALRWLEWLTWAREFAAGRQYSDDTLAAELARRSTWNYRDALDIVQAWRGYGSGVTLDEWVEQVRRVGLDALVAALARSYRT